MKIKIRNVVDIKNHDKERVILDVIKDCNLSEFLLTDTTYDDEGKISNKIHHPFWFPDQDVKENDLVVLYTKPGAKAFIKNPNGAISYFFFWDLKSSIWNDDGDCALLFHIDDLDSKKVK